MATHESNRWENLAEDLIIEILLRLPVKSLLKFRCVSKSWLSLISSPEFKTTYLEISTSRQRLIFGSGSALYSCSLCPMFDEHPSIDNVPYDFAWDYSIKIVGSCNGLVCLVFRRNGSIIVWNPATRKYRRIPFPSKNNFRICYGFGYDESSDDYKVVHISHGFYASYFSIYSVRNNSWKTSDWCHGITYARPGVFVNGAIHWIVYYNGSGIAWGVVAQSMTTENFSSGALPVNPNERQIRSALLGVWGERLCVCFDHGFSTDVWVMTKEYGVKESWSKVVCIPYLFPIMDSYKLGMVPLFVTKKGLVLMGGTSKSMLYRPFGCREIVLLRDATDFIQKKKVTSYVESFVNPNFELV